MRARANDRHGKLRNRDYRTGDAASGRRRRAGTEVGAGLAQRMPDDIRRRVPGGSAAPPGNDRINHIKSIGQVGIRLSSDLCRLSDRMTPAAIRRALLARTEIALLDVRHGEPVRAGPSAVRGVVPARAPRGAGPPSGCRGAGCPSWCTATTTQRRRRRDAAAAAGRLRELGYCDVSLLAGGLAGWAADGGELFQRRQRAEQGVRRAGRGDGGQPAGADSPDGYPRGLGGAPT